METFQSEVGFSYKTVKVTQSRIDKGLLSIPVSLIEYFPKNKRKIYVTLEGSKNPIPRTFIPYSSSSKEARIGGMTQFYNKFGINDGDELVIQILADDKYRILREDTFKHSVRNTQNELDNSKDEENAISKLRQIRDIANCDFRTTLLNEYFRLSKRAVVKRKYNKSSLRKAKEGVPPSIRRIITEIYDGKCQISGFSFLMKNGKRYIEIHHIKPELGNHLKNLLLVSPNVHAQFTHAHVRRFFDDEGWLRRVRFNDRQYTVYQMLDNIQKPFEKEVHYLDL